MKQILNVKRPYLIPELAQTSRSVRLIGYYHFLT